MSTGNKEEIILYFTHLKSLIPMYKHTQDASENHRIDVAEILDQLGTDL